MWEGLKERGQEGNLKEGRMLKVEVKVIMT